MTGIRLSVCCMLLLAIGCSGNAPVAVEGSVALKGSPLDKGEILFVSSEGKAPVTIPISGGKYAGKVPPGTYTIQFTSVKEMKNPAYDPNSPGSTPTTLMNQIPAKWAGSKETREVTSSGPNKFDFDIK